MEDIIYIKDLRIKTIIGIFDWERETKQEVSIDIEFPFAIHTSVPKYRIRANFP